MLHSFEVHGRQYAVQRDRKVILNLDGRNGEQRREFPDSRVVSEEDRRDTLMQRNHVAMQPETHHDVDVRGSVLCPFVNVEERHHPVRQQRLAGWMVLKAEPLEDRVDVFLLFLPWRKDGEGFLALALRVETAV